MYLIYVQLSTYKQEKHRNIPLILQRIFQLFLQLKFKKRTPSLLQRRRSHTSYRYRCTIPSSELPRQAVSYRITSILEKFFVSFFREQGFKGLFHRLDIQHVTHFRFINCGLPGINLHA